MRLEEMRRLAEQLKPPRDDVEKRTMHPLLGESIVVEEPYYDYQFFDRLPRHVKEAIWWGDMLGADAGHSLRGFTFIRADDVDRERARVRRHSYRTHKRRY